MSFLFNKLMTFSEWIEENADSRMKNFLFFGSYWPIVFILTFYFSFVLKFGPKFMKTRKPFNIDQIVMVYNTIQVVLNMYIVKEIFRLVWLRDDYTFHCIMIDYSDTDLAKEKLFVGWLIYLTKVLDLLDTVFFVLRKKDSQLSFLHVYHHSMVLFFGWILLKFFPGGQAIFFGTINSCIHTIMYTYYLLTLIDHNYKKAWWKKYLTIIQLVQFVLSGLHACMALMVNDCNFPKLFLAILLPQDMLMFVLFWNFYKKSYIKPHKLKHS
ncbi:elongation of very long chain fatty acids protein 7-like isoform X2 [Daktulosphaira vitifoliae]|nr:elongation of very long chain fatty acids protein 7-like isoform X2 [Daktulosphaira vitifoliae]